MATTKKKDAVATPDKELKSKTSVKKIDVVLGF